MNKPINKTFYVRAPERESGEPRVGVEQIAELVQTVTEQANAEGYEIVSTVPIIEGDYRYQYDTDHKSVKDNSQLGNINLGIPDRSWAYGWGWGYGFGYGYSVTVGVILTGRLFRVPEAGS